jgi:hypothetical protein
LTPKEPDAIYPSPEICSLYDGETPNPIPVALIVAKVVAPPALLLK